MDSTEHPTSQNVSVGDDADFCLLLNNAYVEWSGSVEDGKRQALIAYIDALLAARAAPGMPAPVASNLPSLPQPLHFHYSPDDHRSVRKPLPLFTTEQVQYYTRAAITAFIRNAAPAISPEGDQQQAAGQLEIPEPGHSDSLADRIFNLPCRWRGDQSMHSAILMGHTMACEQAYDLAWADSYESATAAPIDRGSLPPLPEPWIHDMNRGVQEASRKHYAEDQIIDYGKECFAAGAAQAATPIPLAVPVRAEQSAPTDADVMLAGIHAVCVGASQEYTRCNGVMPQWDSGFFAGQMHVFDMYTKADKTAVSEARDYLGKLDTAAEGETVDCVKCGTPTVNMAGRLCISCRPAAPMTPVVPAAEAPQIISAERASKTLEALIAAAGKFCACHEKSALAAALDDADNLSAELAESAGVAVSVQAGWAEVCPACGGSGETTVMSDARPDAYELPCDCPHCKGSGGLDDAYRGVVALLDAERKKAGDLEAIIYFGKLATGLAAPVAPPASPSAPDAWMKTRTSDCTSAESKQMMEQAKFGVWSEVAKQYTRPLYFSPPVAPSEVQDAARWRALLGSARIRMNGSAGIKKPEPDNYAHFGMEIWTKYSRNYSAELLLQMDSGNAQGREWLTRYADIAIEAQRALPGSAPTDAPTQGDA